MSYADDMSKEQLLSASAIDRYVMEEEASNPEENEKEKEKHSASPQTKLHFSSNFKFYSKMFLYSFPYLAI